jgi:amidase
MRTIYSPECQSWKSILVEAQINLDRCAAWRRCVAPALFAILEALSTPAMAASAFDPANASLEQLRAALDAGRVSSEQLVAFYLDRIERFDKKGPRINALISLNPKALEQARQSDAGKNELRKSLLRGIPFIAKDNYDTAGIATSGGSAALKGSVPSANAFIVQKLIDEGAILLGKSNMSELAASYGRLGYSSAGGLTVNPYNTAREVSGSSSGSAAAVAADFSPFALGTDTGGSVRGPASVAGLVGLRPTLGLTSRSGVIPLSLTFDTTGVLARSIKDLSIVLDAIAGADSQDDATQQPRHPGYAAALGTRSLVGARLGVITNFRGANTEVDDVERTALARLAAQGAVLVPLILPKEFEKLWDSVLGPAGEAEFKPQFERYLRTLPAGQPETLAQLIAISASPAILNSATPVNPERLKALRQADSTSLTDSPLYIHILTQVIPSIRRQLLALLASNNLEAFVFSTMSCPAGPRFDRVDPSYVCNSDDSYRPSYVASAAGFPEVTVPTGRISANMPVGYSFMGRPYSEARLLSLANAFQIAGPLLPAPALAD